MKYRRSMTPVGRLARTYWLDALIVIAAVEGAIEVAVRGGDAMEPGTSVWFAIPAIALLVLPLLLRRRFPFGAPAGVWVLAAATSFVDGRLIPATATATVAGIVAAYLLGNVRDAVQARLGLAVVVGAAAIVAFNDPDHVTGNLVFTPLLFAIGWVAGYAMRGRADQAEAAELRAAEAERQREAAARVAVAEERARIARELHDIVAHAVSVIVLQVGAVRHRISESLPEEGESLQGAESTGRTALTEMRRLLGAMRREEDGASLSPQPGLDALDALIERVDGAGLSVRLHVHGERRPLPDALDVSAYRIVQEGLTNALKHARADHADVTLSYGSDELGIEVRDDGEGAPAGRGDGHGHGLVGIRERVKIYGGEISAEPGSDGGFVLRTSLPVRGESG